MEDLILARTFKKVADTLSFTTAAQDLNMTASAVSRQITRLEIDLGVQLLVRTTRHVRLTDAGNSFYMHCSSGLLELEAAWEAVSKFRCEPQGVLRVRSTPCFGKLHLSPAIVEFLRIYPKVSADLSLGNWDDGFMERGIDVQLRSAVLRGSKRMMYQHLASMRHIICASPRYLEKYGTPSALADLTQHNCLINTRSQPSDVWPFVWDGRKQHVCVSGNFRVDNLEAIYGAVVSGLGIARLPDYLVAPALKAGILKSVFLAFDNDKKHVAFSTSTNTMKAYYDRSRTQDLKISTFISFLQSRFKGNYNWERTN